MGAWLDRARECHQSGGKQRPRKSESEREDCIALERVWPLTDTMLARSGFFRTDLVRVSKEKERAKALLRNSLRASGLQLNLRAVSLLARAQSSSSPTDRSSVGRRRCSSAQLDSAWLSSTQKQCDKALFLPVSTQKRSHCDCRIGLDRCVARRCILHRGA